jgi:Na+/H+ antiporter NhaD/arsenite permease-like protein
MQLQFILLKGVVRAEITLGLLILVAVYAIIILDLLHRTVAALLGSFLAVGMSPAIMALTINSNWANEQQVCSPFSTSDRAS